MLKKYCYIRVFLTDDIHDVQTYRFVFDSQEYKFIFDNVSYMLRDYLSIAQLGRFTGVSCTGHHYCS
jgi:hypothetical protein